MKAEGLVVIRFYGWYLMHQCAIENRQIVELDGLDHHNHCFRGIHENLFTNKLANILHHVTWLCEQSSKVLLLSAYTVIFTRKETGTGK